MDADKRRFIARVYIALVRLFLFAAPCKKWFSPQGAPSPQRGGGAGVRKERVVDRLFVGGVFGQCKIYIQCHLMSINEKMAMSEQDIAAFIKYKDIKLVGDRLITIPKKREKGFFRVEMDVIEEEIDELLSDEISQWIE